jgi:hypothetical protein
MESSLKKNWIRQIEIGPRQILFGPAMDDSRLTEVVISTITRHCMIQGQASLHEIIDALSDPNGLCAVDMLQMIFGLVHELKISFYRHNQLVSPLETKKALLNDPDADIRVVLNQQVAPSIFQAVRQTFQSIHPVFARYTDQHAFAFAALHRLEQWQRDLKTWLSRSETFGYPGTGRITSLLDLTSNLLKTRTAHDLLTKCHDQADHLTAAGGDIQKLADFHSKDASFWDELKAALPRFSDHLDSIGRQMDVAAAYNELTDIVADPDPFDRIQTARNHFDTVTACYQQAEAWKLERCRLQAQEKINRLIRQVSDRLVAHAIDIDTQNSILLTLRKTRKRISGLPDSTRVNQACQDTIDLTLDQMEDLTGSPSDRQPT